MPKLITEWSTDDPGIAAMLKSIAEFPEHSPERYKLEAALHQWQANYCIAHAAAIESDPYRRRRLAREASKQ